MTQIWHISVNSWVFSTQFPYRPLDVVRRALWRFQIAWSNESWKDLCAHFYHKMLQNRVDVQNQFPCTIPRYSDSIKYVKCWRITCNAGLPARDPSIKLQMTTSGKITIFHQYRTFSVALHVLLCRSELHESVASLAMSANKPLTFCILIGNLII